MHMLADCAMGNNAAGGVQVTALVSSADILDVLLLTSKCATAVPLPLLPRYPSGIFSVYIMCVHRARRLWRC